MIIAVAGGKGGVGKSTTAWNLGAELDGIVVDADLASADLPAGSGSDLHDVLAGRVSATEAVDESGPVSLLPCGRSLAGARASDIDGLGAVLEHLERRWEYVILDCPAGLARDVGIELACADFTVLVTAPTRAALVDGIRTANLAADLQTPIAAAVLNLAASENHDVIANRLGRKLGVEVVLVERQRAVADAQRHWLPLRSHDATAQATDAYRSLADRLERIRRRHTGVDAVDSR